MPERLDKIIAANSDYSRSEVKKLIRNGSITVDGVTVTSSDIKIQPSCEISIDGCVLLCEKYVYLMMNKPEGVVSSTDDPKDETVIDLLPEEYRHRKLFPAGRLDKNTTGFVLLTDDGSFAHDILSPKKHIEKTYIVTLTRSVTDAEREEICGGMEIDGSPLLPAKLTYLHGTEYEIVIKEGKYHQIKRMFAKFGNPVTALKRTKMGNLPLDETLVEGECRKLTADELNRIKQIID